MSYILPNCGVRFYEDKHQYWLGDKQLQGITGILGRQLFPKQYDSVPDYILENAARRGSAVHDMAQQYDMFETYSIPDNSKDDDKAIEFIENYVRLATQYKYKNIANEYLVTDNTDYASAIDKVFEMDGKLCLGDIKTTYKLDTEYVSWQLSIYKYLFEVQTGLTVQGLYAIWLRENGKMVMVEDKGEERVKALLEADRKGEQYVDSNVIKVDNGNLPMIEAMNALKGVMVQIKESKAIEEKLRAKVTEFFDEMGIDRWESDLFTFTRVKASMKKVFDEDKFKSENSDLAEEFTVTILDEASLKKKHKKDYERYVTETDEIAKIEHIRIKEKF